jgi:hypothetical protein
MKKSGILFILVILSMSVYAQAPYIQWQKCLGGTDNDEALSIRQTSDSGYIIAGVSSSNNGDVSGHHGSTFNYDCWVIKTSPTGSIQWQVSLGGTKTEYVYSIQQTTDGGYILAAYTQSTDGDVSGNHGTAPYNDVWIVKLSPVGSIQWKKCIGGTQEDQCSAIHQTYDGGYIVAGSSSSNNGDVSGNHGGGDCWIVKLSSSGNIIWQKCLGGSSYESARDIRPTSDSGYILVGRTQSNDGDVSGNHSTAATDFWLVKLSNSGNVQWQKCLGGNGDDGAHSVLQTTDGGYIVAGYTLSNDGDVVGHHGLADIWVIKLSTIGDLQWQKCLGGSKSEGFDIINSILQNSDGSYIVAGQTHSLDGDVSGKRGGIDAWVVKLSPTGAILWQKCFGGTGVSGAMNIQHTFDGAYVFAGGTNSNEGDVSGNHGGSDAWVVKFADPTVGVKEIKNDASISIIPNPTTGNISVNGMANANIKIYNTIGQLLIAANNTNHLSINEFPPGLYLVKVFNEQGEFIKQEKVIKH